MDEEVRHRRLPPVRLRRNQHAESRQGGLPYLSDGWKEAFRFALHMANSLDMDVTIASAPGWSSTGGKWVKPEDAIKKLEWRHVDVRGGKVSTKLPDLYNVVGPYQDYHVGNDRIEVKPYGKDLVRHRRQAAGI